MKLKKLLNYLIVLFNGKSGVIDIHSKGVYPANVLSNFRAYDFIFDGIECASMEGLLQSLKFDDLSVQREICALVGKEAWARGQERSEAWKERQELYCKGKIYKRDSQEYQELLDGIFSALARNPEFRKNLLATGNKKLIHGIGKTDIRDTILTENELCSRLMAIRKILKK